MSDIIWFELQILQIQGDLTYSLSIQSVLLELQKTRLIGYQQHTKLQQQREVFHHTMLNLIGKCTSSSKVGSSL